MKRKLAIASLAIFASTLAHAETQAYDCFPACTPAPAASATIDLCEFGAVREATRVNEALKPAKQVYEIVVNPTGFAIRMVDEHVVHIPKWVGIAMDPKGAARSYVVNYVRDAAKQQVGLQRDCKAPAA